MPERKKHKRPSAAEMDERLVVPVPADQLVKGLLKAGPHPGKAPVVQRRYSETNDEEDSDGPS